MGGSKPVVAADANGRIGVEKQMKVNMTADHRIVYGAQAAGAWLVWGFGWGRGWVGGWVKLAENWVGAP